VRDVDPLRELERIGAGDVRMVLAQEAAPGEVDRLGTRVVRDPEPRVQVIGRQRWAWRHDHDILVVAPTLPRYAPGGYGRWPEGNQKGTAVSFIKRAQEAAAQAAESARLRAQEATGASGGTAGEPASHDMLASASAGAREAIGLAKRGMNTVIEKIDPGTLAELIIKATALQEMTNKSLRTKGSPYRIAEISISASIPPAVSFAISRLGDEPEEIGHTVVSSSELVEATIESGDMVLALDGTTVDQGAVAPVAVNAAPGAMPPSAITSDES
jgi:hypothetical protein